MKKRLLRLSNLRKHTRTHTHTQHEQQQKQSILKSRSHKIIYITHIHINQNKTTTHWTQQFLFLLIIFLHTSFCRTCFFDYHIVFFLFMYFTLVNKPKCCCSRINLSFLKNTSLLCFLIYAIMKLTEESFQSCLNFIFVYFVSRSYCHNLNFQVLLMIKIFIV